MVSRSRSKPTGEDCAKPILESYQRYVYRYRKDNDQPLSWPSQNMHLTQVNQFFRYLVKYNHLPFNPASELELPRTTQVVTQGDSVGG